MKKILLITVFVLLSGIASFAKDYGLKYDDYVFDTEYALHDMDVKGNDIVVMAMGVKDNSTGLYTTHVYVRRDNVWSKLPTKCVVNEKEENVVTSFGQVLFDSEGNIWLTGKYLYKYSGAAWTVYNIKDIYSDYRLFENSTFDSEGTLWITTSIQNQTDDIQRCEIFKFKDGDFSTIYANDGLGYISYMDGNCPFAPYPDGRVGVLMPLKIENGKSDYWIFEKNGVIEKKLTQPVLDTVRKDIKCLYVDPQCNLWICDKGTTDVNIKTYEVKIETSGLSTYSDGKWEVFGLANNYYRASSSNDKYNEPAYWIRKDKHGLYRVLTTSTMRVFSDDHILQRIKWADILKNSTLVRQKCVLTDSANNVQLNEVLTRLVEADTYSYPDNIISTGFNGLCTSKFYYTDNDELVMLSTYGVLVVSPKGYLPVEGESNESIAVYPNPAHDYIYIPNAEDGSSSVIIDVFGREIKQSREGEKQISISDLPSGTYFIRFTNKTKSTKYTKFVKL